MSVGPEERARLGLIAAGCALSSDRCLARCTVEMHGGECGLCAREANPPAPIEWDAGPGWNYIGASVQAIEFDRGQWVVATFIFGRKVNGIFPPILCKTRERAIALAKARARQISPRHRLLAHPRDGEHWKCGHIAVLVASPYA